MQLQSHRGLWSNLSLSHSLEWRNTTVHPVSRLRSIYSSWLLVDTELSSQLFFFFFPLGHDTKIKLSGQTDKANHNSEVHTLLFQNG